MKYLPHVGWGVILVGVFCGFVFATTTVSGEFGGTESKFLWPVAWHWWLLSTVGGSLVLAASRIVDLLKAIDDRLYEEKLERLKNPSLGGQTNE